MQAETTPQTQVHHPHNPTRLLFRYKADRHQPRNVNQLHKAEQAAAGINTQVAVSLTKGVGTMWTAYTFGVLAIIGLFAIIGLLNPIIALLVAWTSQTFLQLVFLPIIMVGQNVLGRKAELIADEQYKTTMSSYQDIEQIMQHLAAQDAERLSQARMLMYLLEKNGISRQQLEAEGIINSHPVDSSAQPQVTANGTVTSTQSEQQNG